MLLRCIRAENRKLHASPIWFMFFILPIISAGYGTFNYLQNLEILRDGCTVCGPSTHYFTRCFSSPAWWRYTRRTCGGWST